jgi:prevent-host-death family protein
MRTIPAGEFKAKCLAIMDEIQAGGESVVITKRGKPVVRVTALEAGVDRPAKESILGFMRGTGISVGDIVGPIIPSDEWDHSKDESALFPTT